MYEVVIDTNVLVSALRSKRGASHELVRSLGQGQWQPTISVALALEYEDVLKRSGLIEALDEAAIDDFLNYLFREARLVPSVVRRRPTLRDPDDERILELAITSGAMIITHNTKHFSEALRFGIDIETPARFLKTLRQDP